MRLIKKLLIVVAGCLVLLVAVPFIGPASSGALLMLAPAWPQPASGDPPEAYEPKHKGHVSLDIGLYFRDNDDIVVAGTPTLVLRRSYASSYRTSREFGIGTTHKSAWVVRGDAKQFQWAEVFRPGEPSVRLERTSGGTSFMNAMYAPANASGEWGGARLAWTGVDWALRFADGTLARFRACGFGIQGRCTLTSYRDADGHVIRYRHNRAGRLERIEASGNRWIALDYDEQDRVVRAYASTNRDVRYEYDGRGRLAQVTSDGAVTHKYTYTDLDEMARIIEPDTDIENSYEGGRCVKQVNRFKDGSPPYTFTWEYALDGSRIAQTHSRHSDGTWERYSFDKAGFTTSESWGADDRELVSFTLQRDPETNGVVSLSLTCADRSGRPLRRSSLVSPGGEEWMKFDLVRTYCSPTRKALRTTG